MRVVRILAVIALSAGPGCGGGANKAEVPTNPVPRPNQADLAPGGAPGTVGAGQAQPPRKIE